MGPEAGALFLLPPDLLATCQCGEGDEAEYSLVLLMLQSQEHHCPSGQAAVRRRLRDHFAEAGGSVPGAVLCPAGAGPTLPAFHPPQMASGRMSRCRILESFEQLVHLCGSSLQLVEELLPAATALAASAGPHFRLRAVQEQRQREARSIQGTLEDIRWVCCRAHAAAGRGG